MTTHPANLLFVCSGNICRSPAAEGLARLWLDARGLENVGTASCGTLRIAGEPAAPFTVQALTERGADISGHRSRPMSYFLLREADLVVCMEPVHRDLALLELGGDADLVAFGVHVVSEWHPEERHRDDAGIYDFVAKPWEEYREGIAEIERCLHVMLEDLFPDANHGAGHAAS